MKTMKLKSTLQVIVLLAVSSLIGYLGAAFIALEANPILWSADTRAAFIIVLPFVAIILYMVSLLQDKPL